MTDPLFLFQLVSAIAYFVLVMMLAMCPYKGEEFRRYNQIRHLYMLSMTVLVIQFVLQMVFGFRAKDDILGAAFNMLLLPFGDFLWTMGVFYTLNTKKSHRNQWTWLISYTFINAIVLLLAYFVLYGTEMFRWFVWLSVGSYMVVFSLAFIALLKEYKRLYKSIQENFSTPLEKQIEWVKHYLYFRAHIILLFPCIAISSFFTMSFSIAAYIGFSYFLVKYMYFGYYIKTIEKVKEVESAPAHPKSITTPENEDKLLAEHEKITLALDTWVKQENFCKSDISIISLAKEIHVSQRTLSAYFKNEKHTTFREWVATLRIKKAKELLHANPAFANETIAKACGFSSRTYFQTTSLNQEGMTPVEWSKAQKGEQKEQ